MDLVQQWINEIENRCKNQGIDTSDCYIMFARNQIWFNGECITGVSESKDGRWVCIPVYNDEASNVYGDYVYSPQCFEVKEKLTIYLSNGTISTLTTVWLLYK